MFASSLCYIFFPCSFNILIVCPSLTRCFWLQKYTPLLHVWFLLDQLDLSMTLIFYCWGYPCMELILSILIFIVVGWFYREAIVLFWVRMVFLIISMCYSSEFSTCVMLTSALLDCLSFPSYMWLIVLWNPPCFIFWFLWHFIHICALEKCVCKFLTCIDCFWLLALLLEIFSDKIGV